jgi:DNA-binding response OmpR family regulator
MTASSADAQNEEAATGGRPGEADPPARARILVADDDATFRRTLVDWLDRTGYEVEAVEDAYAAEQALAERRYDLVIADIQMPGNTQLELLHALREKRIAVPVILTTGHPSVPTAVDALRLAVVDYLIKPLDYAVVLDRIRRTMNAGRLLRVLERMRQEAESVREAIAQCEAVVIARSGSAADAPDRAATLARALSHLRLQVLRSVLTCNEAFALPEAGSEPRLLDLCHLLACPRREAYEDALVEAIAVLERTKHAFRSKDLGVLRKHLEEVLERDRRGRSSSP